MSLLFAWAFGLIALVEILELLWVEFKYIFLKRRPDDPPDWEFTFTSIALALAFYMLCYVPEVRCEAERYCLLILRYYWIPVLLRAIIIERLYKGLRWEEYLLQKTGDMLNYHLKGRYWFRRIAVWTEKRLGWERLWGLLQTILIIWIIATATIVYFLKWTWAYDSILGIVVLLTIYVVVYGFLRALSSCRYLLLVWLALIFAALILQECLSVPQGYGYLVFVVLLCLLWVWISGFADYEAAKMASQCVNTLTTILLLVFDVLVGCLARMPRFAFLRPRRGISCNTS